MHTVFVDNGFDILIVSPNEADALTPYIKKVYESGIPVVIFDRNISDTTYTARIGVDDVGLGGSAAHYALQMLGGKKQSDRDLWPKGSNTCQGKA